MHNVSQEQCQVRFDLKLTDGTWHYANYSSFSVGNSSTNYKLTIGGYSGDAGYDAMARSNGQRFSTYDADHDTYSGNCANNYGGGFWYGACGSAYITVSSGFRWDTSTGSKNLNAVNVTLLC